MILSSKYKINKSLQKDTDKSLNTKKMFDLSKYCNKSNRLGKRLYEKETQESPPSTHVDVAVENLKAAQSQIKDVELASDLWRLL